MERAGDILKRAGWLNTPPGSQRLPNSSPGEPHLSPAPDRCPFCGGTGYIYPSLPPEDPSYGKAVLCTCSERELDGDRQQRLQRYSNLGSLVNTTFARLAAPRAGRAARTELARAIEAAAEYARQPEGWFVLVGGPGTGKTSVAAAITNECIAGGVPALFTVVPDLLDHLRAAFAPQNELTYDALFDQVRNAQVLVLDDLGTHSSTPWAEEKLFQLLNHRYNERLATVVTVDGTLASLHERLRSRLLDRGFSQVWVLEPPEEAPSFQFQSILSQDLLAQMHFENFDVRGMGAGRDEQHSLTEALRVAKAFAQQPQDWLVLTGPVGCGKTHLAAAIANHQLAQGRPVAFMVVADLLDHLRSTYAPQSGLTYDALFDAVRKSPLLILDDLGTQTTTPWAQEKLFQLLNHRYNARLATVITTNLDLPDLVRMSQPVGSRIGDSKISVVIPMAAPDYRIQSGESGGPKRPPRSPAR